MYSGKPGKSSVSTVTWLQVVPSPCDLSPSERRRRRPCAGTPMNRLIDLPCDSNHIETDETSLRIARGRPGGRDWSQLMLIERQMEIMIVGCGDTAGVALRGCSIA